MVKPAWMHVAETFLGEKERRGSLNNEKIVEMFRLIGKPTMQKDEIPWCAAFVGACLALSGYKNSQSALARSYEKFGRDLGDQPQMGCLAVFHRGKRDGGHGHVGFYAGEEDGKILLLGGNQADKVSVTRYSKGRLIGYRWPITSSSLPDSFLPTILDIDPSVAPDHLSEGMTIAPRVSVQINGAFLRCHEVIAKWEGGYSNHPRDPGGATKYGITLKTLRDWRGQSVTARDVKALQYDEALDIFSMRYWQAIQADALPLPLALMTYNAAVNSGPVRGARFLQKALNRQGHQLDTDGEIGPLTVSACRRADQRQAILDYAALHGDFYEGLRGFDVFGKGWLNRLKDVKGRALEWIEKGRVENTSADIREKDLTSFDKIAGGRRLAGKKTMIATGVYLLLVVAEALDILPKGFVKDTITSLPSPGNEAGPAAPSNSGPTGKLDGIMPAGYLDLVKHILLGIAGLSALSKIERGLKTLSSRSFGK